MNVPVGLMENVIKVFGVQTEVSFVLEYESASHNYPMSQCHAHKRTDTSNPLP